MPVPEPSAELGLWPRVRAITGWPAPDEELVSRLAAGWRQGGERFSAAGRFDAGGLDAMWPDAAGEAAATGVRRMLSRATSHAESMTRLAASADRFAAEVRAVKNDIRAMVERNIPIYRETATLPGGFREAAQSRFVNELATAVNRRIEAGAGAVSQPVRFVNQPPPGDEDPLDTVNNGPVGEVIDEVNGGPIGELIDDAGDWLFGDNDNIDNTNLSIDELADAVYQHTGAGDVQVGGSARRPTRDEIYEAIDLGRREEKAQDVEGEIAVYYEFGGVRVIVNPQMPFRSTAYYL
jgi:hypothetical protein